MGVTRWNPQTRAGAVAFRSKSRLDVKAIERVNQSVADWARYQNLSGEADSVETSPIQGNYDWRSYIQEEAQIAQRREAAKERRAKPAPEAPAPAPSVFYA